MAGYLSLIFEASHDVGVIDQVGEALPLLFMELEAVAEEQDSLHGQLFLN